MKRKIPGRKHHGVRDPIKQRAERLKLLKDKINAPPKNPEDQQIPKSLQRLQELRDKVKRGDFMKKKKKGSTTNDKVLKAKNRNNNRFTQLPNETNKQFLSRIQDECELAVNEAQLEAKFKVKVQRNEEGRVVSVEKRSKDPVLEMVAKAKKKLKRDSKKKKKDKGKEVDVPKLSKSQKRAQKLKAKKMQKKLEESDNRDFNLVDKVGFGEQAHAPPTLSVPKKMKTADQTAPRPGKKDLLLKPVFHKTGDVMEETLRKTTNRAIGKKQKNKESLSKAGVKTKKSPKPGVDLTGKRRALPSATRRILEKQRDQVVEAFRNLKRQKSSKSLSSV